MHTSTRRSFIAGGAALGVLGVTGLASCSDDGDGSAAITTNSQATASTLSPVPKLGSPPQDYIRRVGEAYRSEVPGEDDATTLEELLPDLVGLGAAEMVGVLPTLEPSVTEDFQSGRTVELDGWLLAVTEGRAAALISFS